MKRASPSKSVLRIRETEARLRESEERFRTTFEQAAVGLGHLTLEGQWSWVNSRFCRILGYAQEELLEKTSRDVACPENLQALVDHTHALLEGKAESFAVEQRCRRKDGSLVWTDWTVSLVRKSGGEPHHFLVVVQDINVRKWAEENLLRLRAGIDGSSEAIAIADPDGSHAYHNRAFGTMFGYRVEELSEPLAPLALYAEPAVGRAVFAAITEGRSWRGEVEMVARDGRRFPVELRFDAIRDEQDQLIGLIGIHTDISERKAAQAALAQSEARFQSLFDHAPDGIYLIDLHGNFVDGNQAAEQLIGCRKAELIGKSFLTLNLLSQPDLQRAAASLGRTAQGEGMGTEEFVLNRKDGRQVPVEVRAFPITLGKQPLVLGVARDISERKRAEEALWKSEKLLGSVIHSTPDWIFIKDQEHRYVLVNQGYADCLGRSPQDFVGKNDLELGFPESDVKGDPARGIRGFWADDREVMDSGNPLVIEEDPATVNGRVRWHHTFKAPLRDSDGRIWGVLGIARDFTALRTTTIELRKLSRAVEQSPVSVVITDRLGNIQYVNPKFEQMTGYALAEVRGKNSRVLKSGEMRQEAYAELWRTITAGGDWSGEFHNRHKDGTLFWERAFISGIRDEKGQVTHFLAVKEDITERKEAEAELERHREQLKREIQERNAALETSQKLNRQFEAQTREVEAQRTLLGEAHAATLKLMEEVIAARDRAERANVALRASEASLVRAQKIARLGNWDRDLVTNELYWSAQVFELFGIGNIEGGGTHEKFWQSVHPEDRERIQHAVEEAVAGGAPYNVEHRVVWPDGTVRVMHEQGEVTRDAEGRALRMTGTVLDITERKRREAERVEMEALMRQQQKLESIGTLASGVAHEINNPINGAMNYAQLIQDGLPAGSPLAGYAGEILRETQRVATIVSNLLQFSRAEQQSHSPARLTDIIEGTLSLIRTVIRHDQIALTVKVPQDLPELKCRSQQIQQVLMNLMTNARDALKERYPGHDPDKVLNLSAGLFEKEGRRWMRVTVEDHGTGIAPEVRGRMFDPFFTTKPRDKGTGLGLAISHSIVKEHRGELTVETDPGRFTRMHLDLPVDDGLGMEIANSQNASERGGISPPARQDGGMS